MSPPRRFAVQLAVVASAAAGLIHATAVGTHGSERSMVWLFSLCAVAQVGVAGVALIRPTRGVLLAVAGVNGAAFFCWLASRSVGLPFPAALNEVEPVGTTDLIAALLAAVACTGVAAFLLRPHPRRIVGPMWTMGAIVGAMVLTVPALAAGSTHQGHDEAGAAHEQSHDAGHASDHDTGHDTSHDAGGTESGHGHGDAGGSAEGDAGHAHGDTAEVAGASVTNNDGHGDHGAGLGAATNQPTSPTTHGNHDHGTPTTTTGNQNNATTTTTHPNHDHGSTTTTTAGHHPTSTTTHGGHDHPTTTSRPGTVSTSTTTHGGHDHTSTTTTPGDPSGPIISVDDPRLTSAQRDAAKKLIADTTNAVAGYSTPELAEAAGYRSIGDSVTGFEHFVNWQYFGDRVMLDPNKIESLVFVVNPDGSRTLGSGMYIMPLGKTMADAPEIAGELTRWHDHQNLCWDTTAPSLQVVGVTDENGKCARGVFFATPPMLHVWLTPQECGPFAGIEGNHGSGCDHSHTDPTTPTGPIISIDDPRLTPGQRAAAQGLIDRTGIGMVGFTDVASVEAAGYRSIGDAGTGHEHFVNWTYYNDGIEMDENKIESMVFQVNPDGTKQLVSAMYILNPGKTMADVPEIAGELTTWHDHQNLCWDLSGGNPRVVGVTRPDGTCARGAFLSTPPMLHVWVVEHPCGPFAGVDETTESCGVHAHGASAVATL